MFSIFGAKREASEKTIVIVDVGSASVGAALAILDRKGRPTVCNQVRVPLASESSRDAGDLTRRLCAATTQALEAMTQAARVRIEERLHLDKNYKGGAIEHVAVFLPAPWCSLFLNNVRLSRSAPIPVSASLIEKMVADFVRREKPSEKDEAVVERSAVGLRLNGYAADDIPKGATASSIEMTLVSATAHSSFLADMRNAIIRGTQMKTTISFHSTAVAASYALSVMEPQTPDFLLVNVEGEVTELLTVTERIPSFAATAANACAALSRTVMAHAGMSKDEARSALRLVRSAPDSPMAQSLGKTITAAKKTCVEAFQTAARQLVALSGLPQTVFVLEDPLGTPWYAEALKADSSLKELFPNDATMVPVTAARIRPFITPLFSGDADVHLGLETIFADARFDEHHSFNFRVNGSGK